MTESVVMEATQRHHDDFERLRSHGVRIAIDDFGTGCSSLDYLRSFHVSGLKIDRRFVAGVTTNSDDAAIVRAVVGLGLALGVEVIAEGVENEEQRDFLLSADVSSARDFISASRCRRRLATALLGRALESETEPNERRAQR